MDDPAAISCKCHFIDGSGNGTMKLRLFDQYFDEGRSAVDLGWKVNRSSIINEELTSCSTNGILFSHISSIIRVSSSNTETRNKKTSSKTSIATCFGSLKK